MIEIEITPTETIQLVENISFKIIDRAVILTTDRTIKDQNIITIKIDHATVHKTEIQIITTDRETTLNHYIGITHVIKIHNNIRSSTPKHQRQINQVQTTGETQPNPLVLIIQKAQNRN